jgi:RNA ligase (TIGR02306 family)
MRQLVTLRTVKELVEIEGADRIELAKIDGWQCVVKKGDFQVNDNGLFFEIDSLLPDDDPRFSFLEARKFRVRTMKLRGVLSQGLLMPMSILTDDEAEELAMTGGRETDLTAFFRVQKYEPPLPTSGKQKGTFPTHLVPKTDQERIQNNIEILEGRRLQDFEITEKLDGTSCTFFCTYTEGDEGVGVRLGACSRNWEMEISDPEEPGNVYAKLFWELGLPQKMTGLRRSLAIQGEIIGPGVQGNKYKRGRQEFYVFDIWDIDKREYLKEKERDELTEQLDLYHVPRILAASGPLGDIDPILEFADGKSQLYDTIREGLVFKHREDTSLSFKVISNKFLLKEK